MATSKNGIQMQGSIANVSMYKLHGTDGLVYRSKGGPSKNKIKTSPKFEKVRLNNTEWAGCVRMGRNIRQSFEVMKRVEDYSVTGALNAICKQIQRLDTATEPGRRAIRLSQHKDLLSGFSFSNKQTLETVLRVPLYITLDRVTGEARIEIPVLNTGLYLYNFRKLPYYRIVASLSGVCDMQMPPDEDWYETPYTGYLDRENGIYESEWIQALGVQPAQSIHLHYPLTENPIPEEVSLLLCLGIEFGTPGLDNIPLPVKYAGTGKIVRIV
jgi:hypothetical protein